MVQSAQILFPFSLLAVLYVALNRGIYNNDGILKQQSSLDHKLDIKPVDKVTYVFEMHVVIYREKKKQR